MVLETHLNRTAIVPKWMGCAHAYQQSLVLNTSMTEADIDGGQLEQDTTVNIVANQHVPVVVDITPLVLRGQRRIAGSQTSVPTVTPF